LSCPRGVGALWSRRPRGGSQKIGQFCQRRSNAKKPQCAGIANHEDGGNKPKKNPKEDEYGVNDLPDVCETPACRNASPR
jgi:hypothetical protein